MGETIPRRGESMTAWFFESSKMVGRKDAERFRREIPEFQKQRLLRLATEQPSASLQHFICFSTESLEQFDGSTDTQPGDGSHARYFCLVFIGEDRSADLDHSPIKHRFRSDTDSPTKTVLNPRLYFLN